MFLHNLLTTGSGHLKKSYFWNALKLNVVNIEACLGLSPSASRFCCHFIYISSRFFFYFFIFYINTNEIEVFLTCLCSLKDFCRFFFFFVFVVYVVSSIFHVTKHSQIKMLTIFFKQQQNKWKNFAVCKNLKQRIK